MWANTYLGHTIKLAKYNQDYGKYPQILINLKSTVYDMCILPLPWNSDYHLGRWQD